MPVQQKGCLHLVKQHSASLCIVLGCPNPFIFIFNIKVLIIGAFFFLFEHS